MSRIGIGDGLSTNLMECANGSVVLVHTNTVMPAWCDYDLVDTKPDACLWYRPGSTRYNWILQRQ